MELKVWCDGIQRVVCGVSSQTTCQDVVFALAHATAQTGRFILIEKFRNTERLLAPNEHPLTVLSKWGEYANDVTFVMKRSENSGKTQTNLNLNNSITSPTSAANAGAIGTGSPNRRDVFNNSINRKSAIFQHNSDSSTPSAAKTQTPNPTNNSNTTPTLTASPLKSNSCLNSSHNNSTNNTNNINTNSNDLIQTKQHLNNKNNNNCANETTTSPTKSGGHRPRHPPPYSEAINKSALISGTDRSNTSHSNQLDFDSDDRSFNNKRRSIEPSPQTLTKQRTGSQKELLLQRDAIRLVDMQKETMRTQEKEMSSIELQINSIEKKLLENELLIKRYKEEMESLHQLWLDQEVIIDQLDEQLSEPEMDELVAKAQAYEEEVALVKRKLSKCETDIGDCRQRITKLMDQLEDSERQARATDVAKEEKELQLTEQIKAALRDKNKELESQKTELQTLTNSVQQLDSVLNEKNTEVERLLAELKEANIQGLALQTADESHKHYTNRQPFQQRSGSTRRIIGSPRELENAAPTNKNPHGVWV